MLGYPLMVWYGLSRFQIRPFALIMLAVLLPLHLRRLRLDRTQLLRMLPAPLAIAALLILAAIVEDHRFVLGLPVMINLVLLVGFGSSLRSMPLIERFARMQVDDLPADEVAYCRLITWLWCGFFLLNAAIALALVLGGTLEMWTLWNGLLAYVTLGLLFGVEYLFRTWRFRRYGSTWHDRVFSRVWPPRAK